MFQISTIFTNRLILKGTDRTPNIAMTRTVATSHIVIYLVLIFFIRTALEAGSESLSIPTMVPVAVKH